MSPDLKMRVSGASAKFLDAVGADLKPILKGMTFERDGVGGLIGSVDDLENKTWNVFEVMLINKRPWPWQVLRRYSFLISFDFDSTVGLRAYNDIRNGPGVQLDFNARTATSASVAQTIAKYIERAR